MFAVFECQNDAVLLDRRDTSKHIRLLDDLRESRIGHVIQFTSQHDTAAIQPNLFADMAGDQFIVTRQDLDLHAISLQRLQHLGYVRLGRIGKGQKAKQDQGLFVRLAVSRLLGNRAIGYREHPVALRTEILVSLHEPCVRFVI